MLRHLPNAITLLRMAMVLPLGWLIREQRYAEALLLAAVAGSSDALDGWLAKRFQWQSWLGGVLDPIADKLMLLVAFLALALGEQLPYWMVGLVFGRDLAIVLGALAYHILIGPLSASPTLLSKLTTCAQIACVLVVLAKLSILPMIPEALLSGLVWLVAVSTTLSGLDYVLSWSRRAQREWPQRTPITRR